MANFITMIRVFLTPLFVIFMVLSVSSDPNYRFAAFGVFVFGALTDWADGYVARHIGKVTEFGKTADPLADRLFIGATLITLYAMRILPLAFLIIVLGRDIIIALGYPIIGKIDPKKIAVHWTGKVATATLFVALSLLILSSPPHAGSRVGFSGFEFTSATSWQTWGLWFFVIGMIWSLVSGGVYILRVIALVREREEEEEEQAEGEEQH